MTAVSDSPDPVDLKDLPYVVPNPVFPLYPVCTVVYYSTNPFPNPSQLSMWLVNDNPFRPDADRIKDLEQAVKTMYSMIHTMESGASDCYQFHSQGLSSLAASSSQGPSRRHEGSNLRAGVGRYGNAGPGLGDTMTWQRLSPHRENHSLTAVAEAQFHDFYFEYYDRGCTCFISPPCSFCTHPGNPMNLNEDDDAWKPDLALEDTIVA